MNLKTEQKELLARSEKFYPQCSDWGPNEWFLAFIGEVGEAANILKKMQRGDQLNLTDDKNDLNMEFGDAFTYFILWAASCGIDLELAYIRAWNKVCTRNNRPEFCREMPA